MGNTNASSPSLPPLIALFSDPAYQQQVTTLPKAWQYEDLAFFCKIEHQLDKASNMAVRFRLGSVDYVDHLEQKRIDLNQLK